MGKKPSIITKKFKKYKLGISNEPMESYCLPKKFELQPQQKLLPDLLNSKYSPWTDKNIRGSLVFHQIGAGKTCTAITVAEEFKNKLNIVVVLPAALIGNFMTELRSECPTQQSGVEYMKQNERKRLKELKPSEKEFEEIIEKTNKRINKYYTVYSYHKFVELIVSNKIKKLNNTLLIIDEVQNMISMTGTFYKSLNKIINNSNDTLKLLLLSATPMFDRPVEIALTLNLLKKDNHLPINTFNQEFMIAKSTNQGIKYTATNMNKFINQIQGLVSYYRGAPPQAYPKMNFELVKSKMSEFQYKSYLNSLATEDEFIRGSFKSVDMLNMPKNFFLGPRMVLNIAYPNKSINEEGLSSFKKDKLLMSNVREYSIKFYKIMKRVKQSEGTVFVYSNFLEYGGIKPFIVFLNGQGWKDYKDWGPGPKRYSIWSGDEKHTTKEEIKYVFNQKINQNGSQIKMMIGSPSIKEGVSLLRLEQIHIMEPYWNMSRLLQIIGRGIRFCSHKDVAIRKRKVDVYLYLATFPGTKTIDQYIWSLAQKKNDLIQQFEKSLKESAFDCELFIKRNSYPKDPYQISCKNK